jgi:hypothetical protein
MNLIHKGAATVAALTLMLPGAALAKGGHHGRSVEPSAPAAATTTTPTDATAPATTPKVSGKAGAPGQVCKGLKVKGKKTAEQRAAFKQCIKDAVAKRKAEHAAKAKDRDDADETEADDDAPVPAPVTPAP